MFNAQDYSCLVGTETKIIGDRSVISNHVKEFKQFPIISLHVFVILNTLGNNYVVLWFKKLRVSQGKQYARNNMAGS